VLASMLNASAAAVMLVLMSLATLKEGSFAWILLLTYLRSRGHGDNDKSEFVILARRFALAGTRDVVEERARICDL